MNRLDEYAATVASAVRSAACLTGHDWDGATYDTYRVRFTRRRDWEPPSGFVQYRKCRRCGHPVTHIYQHVTLPRTDGTGGTEERT